jgi:hypothetical protein
MQYRPPVTTSSPWKPVLIGCGIVAGLIFLVIVGIVVWLMMQPEGGVKMANEMDKYALDYIKEHNLLYPGETLICYYDATISMTGKEAALLTDQRVMYHKEGATTAIPLREVANVNHYEESLTGDVIEVRGNSGQYLKIEIAPLNQGKSFHNALVDAWNRAKQMP